MHICRELKWIAEFLAKSAGLGGSREFALQELNWRRWLSLLDENHLGAFVGSRYMQQSHMPIPPHYLKEIDTRYIRNGHAATFRQSELLRLLKLLTPHAEIVLLKGCAMIPEFYADAAERIMWDFDLLLHSQREIDALQPILEREGFAIRKQLVGHHHAAPLINPVNELIFELHTNFFTPPLPQEAMEEIWRRKQPYALPDCTNCFILDPVSRLLHHCIHALSDPITSPLLRNLFEIAWMASRLDPSQQDEVPRLAERWGVMDSVARALGLASEIFGTSCLMQRPRRSVYDYWCESRVQWSNSAKWWERFRRHMGQMYVDRILSGSSDRDVRVLLKLIAEATGEAVAARCVGLPVRRNQSLERGDLPHVAIGDTLLVHDIESGHVHLLSPLARQLWENGRNRRPSELVSMFASNHKRKDVESTLRLLIAENLLSLKKKDAA